MRIAIAQKRFIGEFRVWESHVYTSPFFSICICKNTVHLRRYVLNRFWFLYFRKKIRIFELETNVAVSSYRFFYLFAGGVVHLKRKLAIAQRMHIYTIFSTQESGSRKAFDPSLRDIVFSVPRDNRHYPDTLWFSAENKPTGCFRSVPGIREVDKSEKSRRLTESTTTSTMTSTIVTWERKGEPHCTRSVNVQRNWSYFPLSRILPPFSVRPRYVSTVFAHRVYRR